MGREETGWHWGWRGQKVKKTKARENSFWAFTAPSLSLHLLSPFLRSASVYIHRIPLFTKRERDTGEREKGRRTARPECEQIKPASILELD